MINKLRELNGEVAILWGKEKLFMHDANTNSAILFRVARDEIMANRAKINELVDAINELAPDKKLKVKEKKLTKKQKLRIDEKLNAIFPNQENGAK